MSKKDSKKSADKATKNSKKGRDAVKQGKAKVVEETPVVEAIRISEHAVKNEKPEWGAQLDALRDADLAAGMTEKSARVQRASRVRQLVAGKTLPDHGGLFELNSQAGSLELEVQTTTDAPPLPEGMEPLPVEDNPAAQQQAAPADDFNLAGMSKKERKAFLKEQAAVLEAEQRAAQERAEADRLAAEAAATEQPKLSKKAAKQLAKEQEAAAAFVPKAKSSTPTTDQIGNGPDISHTSDDVPELPKTPAAKPAVAGKPAPIPNDALVKALAAAQEQANSTGKKVDVTGPRQYVNKNYGLKLQEKHIAEFPGLEALEDTFDEASGRWVNHFRVAPQK